MIIINVTVGLPWRGTETTDFVEGEKRRILGMQAKPNVSTIVDCS